VEWSDRFLSTLVVVQGGGGEGDPFGASCMRVSGVTELQAP
jgi:hypothetical protein